MAGFYEARRKTADALLKKFGRVMVLRDNEAGEQFNAATGVLTVAGTPVDHPCTGLVYPASKSKRGGGNETTLTQRVILSAEGITKVPTVSDQLVVGSQVYEIKNVAPLEPGGVAVIYELSVVL